MAKYTTKGSKISVDTGSGQVVIPQVDVIDIPGLSAGKIEASDHDSTEKEFLGDLPEREDITVVLRWDPANVVHAYLEAAVGGVEDFVLTIKGASAPVTNDIRTFSGLVTGFQPGPHPHQGGVMAATVTIHPQAVAITDTTP